MNSPNVSFNEFSLGYSSVAPQQGILFVQGIFKRGPFEDPSDIITSFQQFIKIYGGYIVGETTVQKVEKMLSRGAALRVSRLGHYTDVTDKTTLDAVAAGMVNYTLLTFDADLVASNAINMNINAVAISTVNYATSSDNTMALVAAAIAAHAAVEDAYVIEPASGNIRQIIAYSTTGAALTIASAAVTGGASQANIISSNETKIVNSAGKDLFTIAAKHEGADYNNITVSIEEASNGVVGYFNLRITHALEPSMTELYENIVMTATTAAECHFLDDVLRNSYLVTVTYANVSALSGNLYPINGISVPLYNGSDGTAPADADVVGSSAGGTGFYAFDDYDDAMTMGCLETSFADATYLALTNYTAARKDLVAVVYIESSADPNTVITDRDSINFDTSYSSCITGEIGILDPDTSTEIEIDGIGEYMAAIAYAQRKWGYGAAAFGLEQGLLKNVLYVNNNYGSTGRQTDANLLQNRQINMIQMRNGSAVIWGNATGQRALDQTSFLNIRYYLIGVQKEIKPIAERFLGKLNIFSEWRKLYTAVDSILKRNKESDQFIYDYRYDGDQFATSLDALVVNSKTDVGLGKYKARVYIKPTPAMGEIAFDMIITETSVSFEEATELV